MITENLYEQVLLTPSKNLNAKKIYIVSGYATPAMIYKHFEETDGIEINLLIGMAKNGGLGVRNHNAFKQMVEKDFYGRFNCGYINLNKPIHSKTYVWFNEHEPIKGFLGSANYSINGFSCRQGEAMTEDNPQEIFNYYNYMLNHSMSCLSNDVHRVFSFSDISISRNHMENIALNRQNINIQDLSFENLQEGIDYVRLSLVTDKKGPLRVPEKSGLNWGQRPEYNREPNQAYIAIPSTIQKLDFFPERGTPFIVYTDDNQFLDCVRAQENGKGLHTYRNNSIIGEYFRRRLNVRLGDMVRLEDLDNYGRRDLIIYKIDDENYYMDFSV